MKQIIIYIFATFAFSYSYAQVGIGTTNPQEELHVAGTTSTIRIDALNNANNLIVNPAGEKVRAYVDGNGDITFANGFGASEQEPLNFLIDIPNFIPNDPYGLGLGTPGFLPSDTYGIGMGSGVVINNPIGTTETEGEIIRVTLNMPQDATIEVKYAITTLATSNDMTTAPPSAYIAFDKTITTVTYFCLDLNADGLDATEKALKYGYIGQSYETNNGGSIGFPYMNSHGYLSLPQGNHELVFFGVVKGSPTEFTSVGFGGTKDFLKIRVYN